MPSCRETDATAKNTIADDTGPGTQPMVLDSVHPGTAHDMQTAMRLFGSAIVYQVDTSVSTVLSENHQMREMASEMATASEQAKDQFRGAMSRAVEAEGGIEQLNAYGNELSASIGFIGSEVKRSIAIGPGGNHKRLRRDHGGAVADGVRRYQDD